uniref:Putative peptidoglycan peptidase n=1 Tax=uncultured Verrucomicrobiota bacterium TaxID=156588 RepID=D2DXX9_9BACT|nr:putative peptidoglycan peptidase [uncultured Verrucomicrobiota bacterium]
MILPYFAQIRILLAVVAGSGLFAGCASLGKPAKLRSGDIVFQDSSPHSGQAVAIKKLTRSAWSHCGIYFAREGRAPVVIDGNGTQREVLWEAWKSNGAGGRYAAFRLKRDLSEGEVEALWRRASFYDGRPYDLKFAWDDGKIYCSELIWKACRDALKLEIGKTERLADFDLRDPAARALIERPGSWGTVENAMAHGEEVVVSPQAIAQSPLLRRVR